ncbi:hypothetical protein [Phormidium sp. CCY1219]|nr:hypothetical protein [Phormidium sp. CCY1219]MEB3827351.1 hypothetical protein [Phormidium sp. CCY1219]
MSPCTGTAIASSGILARLVIFWLRGGGVAIATHPRSVPPTENALL